MIICADDYGLREEIDIAILELAASGRLSAVSCMTAVARCSPEKMAQMLAHRKTVDVGLHLCLTHEPVEFELTPHNESNQRPEFGTLLKRALLGRIGPETIAKEVAAQYQTFVSKSGTTPDYIDGHLHVHQLPNIRQGLIDFLRTVPEKSRPYIRNTRMEIGALRRQGLPSVKAVFIGHFGRRLENELKIAGIRTNDGFSGIYDFHGKSSFEDFFPRFMECVPHRNGILVVHPGKEEDWRRKEFGVLSKFPFRAGTLNKFC